MRKKITGLSLLVVLSLLLTAGSAVATADTTGSEFYYVEILEGENGSSLISGGQATSTFDMSFDYSMDWTFSNAGSFDSTTVVHGQNMSYKQYCDAENNVLSEGVSTGYGGFQLGDRDLERSPTDSDFSYDFTVQGENGGSLNASGFASAMYNVPYDFSTNFTFDYSGGIDAHTSVQGTNIEVSQFFDMEDNIVSSTIDMHW